MDKVKKQRRRDNIQDNSSSTTAPPPPPRAVDIHRYINPQKNGTFMMPPNVSPPPNILDIFKNIHSTTSFVLSGLNLATLRSTKVDQTPPSDVVTTVHHPKATSPSSVVPRIEFFIGPMFVTPRHDVTPLPPMQQQPPQHEESSSRRHRPSLKRKLGNGLCVYPTIIEPDHVPHLKMIDTRQDTGSFCLDTENIQLDKILLKMFGYTSFFPGQVETINNILRGQSTLILTGTGTGKSLCYQIPAYLYRQKFTRNSIVLVISPLVSLMRDQMNTAPKLLNTKFLHTNQSITYVGFIYFFHLLNSLASF